MTNLGTVFFGGRVKVFRNPANRPFVEDDAFVFQARWRSPDEIDAAWRKASASAARQAQTTPFAWSERHGYLSPVPEHIGCGIEVSAKAHLIGLNLIGEDMYVFAGLEAMRQYATCTNAEGLNAVGRFHTVESAGSIGRTESDFVKSETRIFQHLLTQERNARKRLLNEDHRVLEDSVARALAILSSARLISRWELADILSPVRFAAEAGLVVGISLQEIDNMFLKQLESGEFRPEPTCLAEERDRDREDAVFADRVNKRFKHVKMI